MALANKNMEVGQEIPSLTKLLTAEASQLYSGWPETRNLHTDIKEAQKIGFPGMVAAGLLGAAQISEMCTNFFGESWFTSGKLSVRFTGLVIVPQKLTAKGMVKEKIAEESKVRLVLDVWLENEKGDKVRAGTASALAN